MCSEYQVKTTPKQIEKALGVSLTYQAGTFEWGKTVKFFSGGPVIEKNSGGDLELNVKIFPTSPMPNSRLSGLEGQSDRTDESENETTQIKRIYDMPSWKEGFKNHPVLVPASEFTEFAYWGPEIGSAQGFKIPKEEVMFIAGLAIKPFTPKGEKFSGYSLITHTATEQMLDYHHRLIVLLPKKLALGYLDEMTSEERVDYLLQNRYTGPLDVRKVRAMGKGWEKRIERQEQKLQRELKYGEVLNHNHISG